MASAIERSGGATTPLEELQGLVAHRQDPLPAVDDGRRVVQDPSRGLPVSGSTFTTVVTPKALLAATPIASRAPSGNVSSSKT